MTNQRLVSARSSTCGGRPLPPGLQTPDTACVHTRGGPLSRVFQGSTVGAVVEDFIKQLLHHCRPYPEPNSVLVIDNASFHHSERITHMCDDTVVKLLYLPPYSPDFNPIEDFFTELKAFIKKQWHEFESSPHEEFGAYLEWCVSVVGGREESAKGYFRDAGVTIEELGSCISSRKAF